MIVPTHCWCDVIMRKIESLIQSALKDRGFECHSVFRLPDEDELKLLIAFRSKNSKRLTTNNVERVLNSLGIGDFKSTGKFQRLSAAFVHLEIMMGARTEQTPDSGAG